MSDRAPSSTGSVDVFPQGADQDIVVPGAASALFWMLPSPSAFLERVTTMLNRHRAVAIHLNERMVLGHQAMIDQALARSQFDGPSATTLRVYDASQIDCDIAQHLCASNDRKQISALAMADWHTRRRQAETGLAAPRTFVLRPQGELALNTAWSYLMDFAQALPQSSGNTRLILLRIDAQQTWDEEALKGPRASGHFDAAAFEGALGPDEMAAYLGMRMTITGLGHQADLFGFPVKRLARCLVAEFAGFDAHFAEGLMLMREDELLQLPQSLGSLAARLPVSDAVWRQTSAELGTLMTVGGETIVHTLHEWHLASHAGPFQKSAEKELERKKWRAYLSALMPWFEELRHELMHELRSLLEQHLAPTQGHKVRTIHHTGAEIRIPIDDLECGDITAMTKGEGGMRGRTVRERTALDLCHKVSRVRNEIAHLRPPLTHEISKLIESLQDHQRARRNPSGGVA